MTTSEQRVTGLQTEVHLLQGRVRRLELAVFLGLALVTAQGPAARLGDPDEPARARGLSFLGTAARLLGSEADDFGSQDFVGPVLLVARLGILLAIVALGASLVLGWSILARPTGRAMANAVTGVAIALIVGCALTAVGVWLLPTAGSRTLAPAYALLTGLGAGVWLLLDARE